MSNWITIEELDLAVIDWCQKFEDRVVNPLLDADWASNAAKHGVHWLFMELRDRACEGDGKEVKRLAAKILDHWNEQVARFHEHHADDRALNGGSDG
jgi:hypothetical protein